MNGRMAKPQKSGFSHQMIAGRSVKNGFILLYWPFFDCRIVGFGDLMRVIFGGKCVFLQPRVEV
jgi:hypothetical protein